jgi:dTDP-4-dehydrorhamnose reductase
MIVAVLGANGQLGSDIVRAVAGDSASFQSIAICRDQVDVSNLDAIPSALSAHRFDVLVNCASYHKTDEVETHATEAFRINAHAVATLARACRERHARFVHISTDYVFDGTASEPYSETDYASPLNVYGASKLLGERLALREHRDGTMIMRVASLFGVAGSSGKGGNFIETILRRARETGEVRVVNDITMSPTCTSDVARSILAALKKNAPSGVYHIVNSGSANWFEFADQIISEAGVQAKVVPVPSAEFPTVAQRPSYSVLNNAKISAIVGALPHWKTVLGRYLAEKGHVAMAQAIPAAD